MFVSVDIRGDTMPYREVLGGTYDLRWNKNRKCYTGNMKINGLKIENLTKFCNIMELKMAVDGVLITADLEEEEETQIKEVDFDDSQLGKIGNRKIGTSEKSLGYKKVTLKREDEPLWDCGEFFEGTRFPEPRPEQSQVIPQATNLIEQGYKNIIIECPTGSGKSAMAMMLPKIFNSDSYVVTHLKGLQEQYMREMPFMRSVMGKGNYECSLDLEPGCLNKNKAQEAVDKAKIGGFTWQTGGCTANMAPCTTIRGFQCPYKVPRNEKGYDWSVDPQSLCEYFDALTTAQNANYFISNMSYLMAMNRSSSMLRQRKFLIVDEAHQLASAMTSFYSLDFSVKVIERLLQLPSHQQVLEAAEKDREIMQKDRTKNLESWTPANSGWGFPQVPSVQVASTDEFRRKGAVVLAAYFDALINVVSRKIRKKDYEEDELKYIYNTLEKIKTVKEMLTNDWKNCLWQANDDKAPEYISFKPLDIKDYSEELMLNTGQVRVFLSGTIGNIDIFCDELGLKKEDTAYLEIGYSSFPISNRPIYTSKVGGKMSYSAKSSDEMMKTAEAIVDIMNLYPRKKGLILPYTDSLEKQLVEAIEYVSSEAAERLVQHGKGSKARNEIFNNFDNSQGNNVLISTYANQGYDGKSVDFCIIVKVPFPAMGDVRTAIKMKENPSWYKLQTANQITQMLGRVVRSAQDVGHNYIIDPQFWFHYSKGIGNEPLENFIPEYIKSSIRVNRNRTNGAKQSQLFGTSS